MLSLMNVASIQLHPNNWAFLCAFQILCKSLNIEPTVHKFVYFYQLKMGAKVGWPSLNTYKFEKLFQLYTQSWKNFKSNLFWVWSKLVCGDSRELFFMEAEKAPKFPFYWQWFPFKFKSYPHQILSPKQIKDIVIIGKWQREMSCKFIVTILTSDFPYRIYVASIVIR